MSKKIYGWIYKISHEDMPKKCYIGRTEVSIKKRFEAHIRASKKANRDEESDAKLHKIMWAHQPETFKIEEVDTAVDLVDLKDKELLYQKKFDSIDNGWNKNKAANITQARGKPIAIKLLGVTHKATSKAQLCRKLGISNSTLNYWLTKGKTLRFSAKKALEAKKSTHGNKPLTVFRRSFKSVTELAKDKLNKNNLHPATIRQRVKNGKTYEEALLEKPKRAQKISVIYENKTYSFKSVTEAHKTLSKIIKDIPAYSSVISAIGERKSPEESFGIEEPTWLKNLSYFKKLLNEGYTLTGTLSAQSKPQIYEENKEIFASMKDFSNAYNFDYTTVVAEINSGLSLEEIIRKRNS
jgi:hypothetical protein